MFSQKMERKPSFKERAFEKLGISGSRPKSQSFDGSSVPNICGGIEPGVAPRFLSTSSTPPPNGQWKQQYTITTRPMDVEEILSNLGMARAVTDIPTEKKKSTMNKPQPKGSKEYLVSGSDTLESVAAQFDTTPSELVTLNKLTMRMIFPGETIFVPDPEYIPPVDPPPDLPADPPVLPTASTTQARQDTPSPLSLDPVTPDSASTTKHISSQNDSNTSGSTSVFEVSRPKLDIPLVAMSAKPLKVVPGHAERQTPITSPDQVDPTEILPRTLSMDETKRLDKECFERFIKINVKHITDGQGVVNGVLLVTPNAVMFDPNVSDPLVIEHGPEKYGMIATMDTIISAAMYHDIAAMKLRGQREDEREPSPRPEVYRATKTSADSETSSKKSGSNSSDTKISPIPQTTTCSDSSDKFFTESGEFEPIFTEAADRVASCSTKTDASSNDIDNSQSKTEQQTADLTFPNRDQSQTLSHHDLAAVQPKKESGVTLETERERSVVDDDSLCFPKKHKSVDLVPVSFKEIPKRSSSKNYKGLDSTQQHDLTDSILSNITSDIVNNSRKSNLSSHSSYGSRSVNFDEHVQTILDAGGVLSKTNTTLGHLGVDSGNETFESDDSVFRPISPSLMPDMQIGNINYFQYEGKENKPTPQSLDSMDVDDSKLSPIHLKQHSTTELISIPGSENETDSSMNIKSSSPLSKSPTGTGGVFGSLPSSPHISAFVNYATGLFRSNAEDRTNIKDIVDACSTKVRNLSGGSSSGGTPPHSASSSSGLPSWSSARGFIEVENIIKLADMPELFQSLDKLIPRPALRNDDPPLYLCLRVGQPINKQISTGGPIESYGKKKKKPEYWFSIPRDKVDQLYAFFIQWSPDKYGDEEDIDAAERGFVVIGDDLQNLDHDDSLDIFDEYFGPESSQRIHRDWEIVTRSEALRRMNSMEADSVIIPELLGQSSILNEERIRELTKALPARAVGYPWTLTYSTDLHGFSLKTLYRGMHRLEGPILLVIEDTAQHVFGAMTSCPLKISDHFYGTGDSFLYTFTPEFKIQFRAEITQQNYFKMYTSSLATQMFPWAGENHFCIKGNKESLAIGAGQGNFGLWFDESLFHGRSHCCETYNNDVLSASEDFVVKTFEAWAFVDIY